MSAQTVMMTIASVILVLMLGLIGYLLYKAKSNLAYPPDIAECPDYWTVIGENNCSNVKNLGKCSGTKNFNSPQYQGSSGLQQKYCWARNCNIVWDGVTNNGKVPTWQGKC